MDQHRSSNCFSCETTKMNLKDTPPGESYDERLKRLEQHCEAIRFSLHNLANGVNTLVGKVEYLVRWVKRTEGKE